MRNSLFLWTGWWWICGRASPRLKKRTRHWCSHGLEGSIATALFIDWSINRNFSVGVKAKGFFALFGEKCDSRNPLTFPKINLKGQQVGLNLVAHQVLQGDQELHCLLQRILRLKKEVQT